MMDFEALAELIRFFEERIPFNRVLGLELDHFGPEEVRVSLRHRPELVGNYARGNLHGGVISATLDLVGGLVALAAGLVEEGIESLEEAEQWFSRFGTIDIRVDYLRPALGAHFVATGRVQRVGKRVAVTRMEMADEEGTLIASGTGTYILG